MSQEAEVILKEKRLCPDCGSELRLNLTLPSQLEIERWKDEYFFCEMCKEDWTVMWVKGVITTKIDENERQFTLS